jgi:hypothetical protein
MLPVTGNKITVLNDNPVNMFAIYSAAEFS